METEEIIEKIEQEFTPILHGSKRTKIVGYQITKKEWDRLKRKLIPRYGVDEVNDMLYEVER